MGSHRWAISHVVRVIAIGRRNDTTVNRLSAASIIPDCMKYLLVVNVNLVDNITGRMIDDNMIRIWKLKRVSVVVVVVVVQESSDFTSVVVRLKIFIATFRFGAPVHHHDKRQMHHEHISPLLTQRSITALYYRN